MRIDILTLFPGMFTGPMTESMIKRAQEAGHLDLGIHDMREHSTDKHRMADDRPFGGGAGMVIKPDMVFAAVESLPRTERTRIIMTCPQGKRFEQADANALATEEHLMFLCGHYEGFDERVREHLVTDEYSIGDYVLTNGELPAMVMLDAIVRLIPGVVGKEESTREDSFYTGILDYPHYTRPVDFRGWQVPEILRGGNHGAIQRWRRDQALLRTFQRRPELLASAPLDRKDLKFLKEQCGWEP
ncbi:MAG TPA: tRNA (guanosine(37)-N1)-methyltransferase TrmD [Pantanalinema sp.]